MTDTRRQATRASTSRRRGRTVDSIASDPRTVTAFQRFDDHAHRFWIAGRGGFEIAAWDWSLAADWCWDCGDDFVIYNDPDHSGWYLVYNVHTGIYVHGQFIGT